MKVIVIVDGIERVVEGSYDELMNRDWNELVTNQVDTANTVAGDMFN